MSDPSRPFQVMSRNRAAAEARDPSRPEPTGPVASGTGLDRTDEAGEAEA